MARLIKQIGSVMVISGGLLSCPGQTNGPDFSSPHGVPETPLRMGKFFQPTIQLRSLCEPKEEPVSPSEGLGTNTPAQTDTPLQIQKLQLFNSPGDGELHSSVINSHVFYLTRDELHFDSKVNRFIDQVYRPEVFHVGKVPMSLSIVTAIKRKNPLCLLNPIVFQVSW